MGTEKQLLTAPIAEACLIVAGIALAAQPVNKPVLRHARFIFRAQRSRALAAFTEPRLESRSPSFVERRWYL